MKMFAVVVVTWISAVACAQKAKVEAPPPPPPPEVQEIHREAEAFQSPADAAPVEDKDAKKAKKKKAAKKSTKSKKG